MNNINYVINVYEHCLHKNCDIQISRPEKKTWKMLYSIGIGYIFKGGKVLIFHMNCKTEARSGWDIDIHSNYLKHIFSASRTRSNV